MAASTDPPHYIVESGDRKIAAREASSLAADFVMRSATLRPTADMAANAKRGLGLRERFGRGGTEVGVRRAEQLIAREELEPADIKSMYSYFARHAVDKKAGKHRWESDEDPSAGFIAWLLWGGDEGKTWVDRQRSKLS